MADFIEEPPIEENPPHCLIHHDAPVAYFDADGNPWCEACRTRCEVMNAGFYRQFPAQRGRTFSIADGRDGWRGFALGAADALIEKIAAHLGVKPVTAYKVAA